MKEEKNITDEETEEETVKETEEKIGVLTLEILTDAVRKMIGDDLERERTEEEKEMLIDAIKKRK